MATYVPFQPSEPGPAIDPSMYGFEGQQQSQALVPMDHSQFMAEAQQLVPQQAANTVDTLGARPVEPLPPDRLWRMFQAWQDAKSSSGELAEQHKARRYYHGKQWTAMELAILKLRGQPAVTSNRIKRKCDFLVGVEQRLRRDVKAFGRNPIQEQSAWVATGGLRYVQDANRWPDLASEAAHNAFVSGIGCVRNDLKMRRGQIDIIKNGIPPDRFFYDPRSERWDFSDARYLGTHQWMDMDEALELLPAAHRMINALASAGGHGLGGVPTVLPSDWTKEINWVDSERRRLYVVEIHYKHKGQWMFNYICGPQSLLPIADSMYADEETGQWLSEKAHDFMSPYRDEDGQTMHPFEAWSPYVDEMAIRYGVVRDMISPQDEINKRRSKLLHMLSVRQTKGTKGAVDDPEAMKKEMAKADGHVEINPGPDTIFDVIDQSDQVKGQAELLAEAKGEIENLGPNPGLIGRGVESQSGRAILAQQNSGMTELSPVFERCRTWKLNSFRKDWFMMKQFWKKDRWIRITGDAGAPQFLGLNQIVPDGNSRLGIRMSNYVPELDVDIILDEGPDTITMQEELMEQLATLPAGTVPPEVIIELSNIKDKAKIQKMMADAKAPDPKMVQLQETMAKLEMFLAAANVDKAISETEKNRAAALETGFKAGIPVASMPAAMQVFPFQYGGPSHEQRFQGAQTARNQLLELQAQEQEESPQEGGPVEVPVQQATQQQGPAVPGQEPKLGQEGGLPLGNEPGAPEPEVPTQ